MSRPRPSRRPVALSGMTLLSGVLLACSPAPEPPSVLPPSTVSENECAAGAIRVGPSADDLRSALADARPGDVLQLADVTYVGRFVVAVDGEAAAPITLCGGSASALDGESVDEGYTLHLDGAEHWILAGFAVTQGAKGIVLDDAHHNELRGLEVSRTGDEAVHLRSGSSDNVVRDSLVHDTGLVQPEFGEGIYVGSAESNWERYSGGQADASDRNQIVDNEIRATTAEAIDVKEGTTGGVIRGNVVSIADPAEVDSVIDIKGNDWVVDGNEISVTAGDGIQVHSVTDGWGARNRFAGNRVALTGDGEAIAIVGAARELGNVVE